MKTLSSGRKYRVTGASAKTGEDVEILVEAYDAADAARAANRQGVFVSACVPAAGDGSNWAGSTPAAPPPAAPKVTLAQAIEQDPVVQRLVRSHPQLAPRVKRLNDDDQACLRALAEEGMGISYRDSAYVGKLMNELGNSK